MFLSARFCASPRPSKSPFQHPSFLSLLIHVPYYASPVIHLALPAPLSFSPRSFSHLPFSSFFLLPPTSAFIFSFIHLPFSPHVLLTSSYLSFLLTSSSPHFSSCYTILSFPSFILVLSSSHLFHFSSLVSLISSLSLCLSISP